VHTPVGDLVVALLLVWGSNTESPVF
jgi:hypothetical protein